MTKAFNPKEDSLRRTCEEIAGVDAHFYRSPFGASCNVSKVPGSKHIDPSIKQRGDLYSRLLDNLKACGIKYSVGGVNSASGKSGILGRKQDITAVYIDSKNVEKLEKILEGSSAQIQNAPGDLREFVKESATAANLNEDTFGLTAYTIGGKGVPTIAEYVCHFTQEPPYTSDIPLDGAKQADQYAKELKTIGIDAKVEGATLRIPESEKESLLPKLRDARIGVTIRAPLAQTAVILPKDGVVTNPYTETSRYPEWSEAKWTQGRFGTHAGVEGARDKLQRAVEAAKPGEFRGVIAAFNDLAEHYQAYKDGIATTSIENVALKENSAKDLAAHDLAAIQQYVFAPPAVFKKVEGTTPTEYQYVPPIVGGQLYKGILKHPGDRVQKNQAIVVPALAV